MRRQIVQTHIFKPSNLITMRKSLFQILGESFNPEKAQKSISKLTEDPKVPESFITSQSLYNAELALECMRLRELVYKYSRNVHEAENVLEKVKHRIQVIIERNAPDAVLDNKFDELYDATKIIDEMLQAGQARDTWGKIVDRHRQPVDSIPAPESYEKSRFLVSWTATHRWTPDSKVYGYEFFNRRNGYTFEDFSRIMALNVRETMVWAYDDPNGKDFSYCTVFRIS